MPTYAIFYVSTQSNTRIGDFRTVQACVPLEVGVQIYVADTVDS